MFLENDRSARRFIEIGRSMICFSAAGKCSENDGRSAERFGI